jgi:hypothetical protein
MAENWEKLARYDAVKAALMALVQWDMRNGGYIELPPLMIAAKEALGVSHHDGLFLKGTITDAYEAGYRIDPATGRITTKAE